MGLIVVYQQFIDKQDIIKYKKIFRFICTCLYQQLVTVPDYSSSIILSQTCLICTLPADEYL